MQNPYLAAIRAAHIERCAAAELRSRRLQKAEPVGLPYSLVSAGCWLVHHGWDGPACAAEKALGWGPARYRQFLDTLTADALTTELEEGRKALFDGRHPIYVEQRRAA